MGEPRGDRETVLNYSIDIYIRLALITLFGFFSFPLIWPFIGILAWAMIFAVALYPVFVWLSGKLGGKGSRAATLMTLVGLVLLLTPTVLIVDSLIHTFGNWAETVQSDAVSVPPPPETVKDWPLVGNKVHAIWSAAASNLEDTLQKYSTQVEHAVKALVGTGTGLIVGILQLVLSIIFAGVFLGFSRPLTDSLKTIASRMGSQRGSDMIDMAGATIRNVSRGVVGVALVQSGLGALGVYLGDVPFAGVVCAVLFLLCLVQLPPLGFIPLIIYAWTAESTTFALIFTVYMLACMLLDNFLKPILMGRGLQTPMVVILIGVIGGTIAGGLMGLFIGPVILALFHKMIAIWIGAGDLDDEEAATQGNEDRALTGGATSPP